MDLKTVVTRKHSTQIFQKQFLLPDTQIDACVSGGKECKFFGKSGVLCFLVTIVLRFTLLPLLPTYSSQGIVIRYQIAQHCAFQQNFQTMKLV